jgi:hypothetical protein
MMLSAVDESIPDPSELDVPIESEDLKSPSPYASEEPGGFTP